MYLLITFSKHGNVQLDAEAIVKASSLTMDQFFEATGC
jgi:hypothetical protein